jgi:transposase
MTELKKHRRRKKDIINKKGESFLSVSEISKRYRFHQNTIRAWVNRDGLKHIHKGPGSKIYIGKGRVERFIENWYE